MNDVLKCFSYVGGKQSSSLYSESVSQWHRHAAAGFISIFNNRLFFCPLQSHAPLCDTVHCCHLKAVQKQGKVK